MTFSNRRRFVGTSLMVVGVVLLSLTSVTASGAVEQEGELDGSIGDHIWFDDNDNGRLDEEEAGVGGVVLELFSDTNRDGAPDGPMVQSATSAADGSWRFVGLAAGPYAVQLPASNWDAGGALRGCVSSAPTTVDARDGVDGDDNGFELAGFGIIGGPIVLSSERMHDDSLDFGCHRPVFDVAVELDAGTGQSLEPGDLLEIRVDVRNDGTLTAEALAISLRLSEGLLLADPDWEELKDGSLLRHLAIDRLRPGITASVVVQVEIGVTDGERQVAATLASVRSALQMPNGDRFEMGDSGEASGTVITIGGREPDEGEADASDDASDTPAPADPTDPTDSDQPAALPDPVEPADAGQPGDPVEPADPTLPDTEVEGVSVEAEPAPDAAVAPPVDDGDAVDAAVESAPDVPRQAVAPADIAQPAVEGAPVLALTGAEDRALILAALMCIVAGAMLLLLEQWMRPGALPQK